VQKTLYIFHSGSLKRKGNTIYVKGEEKTRYFPVASVRDIFIFGEVDMNKKMLEFAHENELTLHFFGYYDNYVGSFYPREHNNSGYMVLRQAEYYLDHSNRFKLARIFVRGALENIIQVLRYYQNRGKEIEKYLNSITEILEQKIPHCKNIEELMAMEGNARSQYYKSFNLILNESNFTFKDRSKRPPLDPLNALISFANSMVYVKVLSEIYKTHLDPRIGFLHSTNFRRFSLNLDVAEVFKPVIADRCIFSLVSKSKVKDKDFENKGGAVLLKDEGRKTFVQELEDKLQTTFYHRRLKRKISYQSLIRMELYKIEKHLMGEKEYQPFVSRW